MGDRSHEAIASLVEQLLDDPLVQLVMVADRVDRDEARAMLRVAALKVETVELRSDWLAGEGEKADLRPGVGIVLFNERGEIFLGERADLPGAWQMPQGGIDAGEAPYEAARRELREEIGTNEADLLGETRGWLAYELPPEVVGQLWGGRWRGQMQKWFAMLFRGDDRTINLGTEHPEFTAWRWASVQEAIELIAPFKRPVYEHLAAEFGAFAQPDAGQS